MKLPFWLKALVAFLALVGFIGFVGAVCNQSNFLKSVADLALVLTLAALIVYSYYTYLIAKEAWTPSASFALVQVPGNPYHFLFLIQNHSKASLRCWCRLNPSVYGQQVKLSDFYGGETSFDVQPFGVANGHFDVVTDILAKVGRTPDEMKQKLAATDIKRQLYLDIEFWYQPYVSSQTYRNVRQPHYFDFGSDALVANF